jgi:hypothetical protein
MLRMPAYGAQPYGGPMGAVAQPYPQAFPTIPMLDPRLFGGMVPVAPR